MKLSTRRQFIGQALSGFSATVLAHHLLPWESMGAEIDNGIDLPFLVFDCAGGAAFPGNFLVTGEGGRPLANYSRLGFDGRKEDNLDRAFGLPMARNESSILKGMKQAASVDALAKLRMGSFCHFSLDDQGGNALSSIALAYAGSRKGSALNAALGTNSSLSGGNSSGPLLDLMPRPTQVTKIEDFSSSVGFGAGSSLQSLKKERLRQYAGVLKGINRRLAERLIASGTKTQVYDEIAQQIESSPSVDPRAEPLVAAVYGLNPNSATNSVSAVSATVVKSVLQGLSGPGVITIGGCDYHDRGSVITEAKDLEIGITVGRAVETAHRLKRPLFFQLITDGGVGNEPNTRNWKGDDGSKCMTVIGYYHPERLAEYADKDRFQIGHYTEGQGADTKTFIGDASGKQGENLAYAVIANYFSLGGKLGRFQELFRSRLTDDQLKSILVFRG